MRGADERVEPCVKDQGLGAGGGADGPSTTAMKTGAQLSIDAPPVKPVLYSSRSASAPGQGSRAREVWWRSRSDERRRKVRPTRSLGRHASKTRSSTSLQQRPPVLLTLPNNSLPLAFPASRSTSIAEHRSEKMPNAYQSDATSDASDSAPPLPSSPPLGAALTAPARNVPQRKKAPTTTAAPDPQYALAEV